MYDDVLDPILNTLREPLRANVASEMTSIYVSGDTQMVTWGKTRGGIPIAYEGPPMEEAISYAQNRSAQLVTGMDKVTKDRLANVISQGIKEKRGIPGLARDIRREMGDMTMYRSKMIARTETSGALEQAFLDRSKKMGVTGKEAVTSDPCPICAANEGDGVIPMDATFSSGHQRPPFHPNCVCALAPSMLPYRKVPAKPTPRVKPAKPPIAKPVKPPKGVSQATQDLINKIKVTGKSKYDVTGPTEKALRAAKLPDSHLATVRSLEINRRKVNNMGGMCTAYCDGKGNIVVLGTLADENIVHEIGHAVFTARIPLSDKYLVADAFNAAEKTGKGFISFRARADTEEFFAECYAAFARNPAALAKANKPMATLLKKHWK